MALPSLLDGGRASLQGLFTVLRGEPAGTCSCDLGADLSRAVTGAAAAVLGEERAGPRGQARLVLGGGAAALADGAGWILGETVCTGIVHPVRSIFVHFLGALSAVSACMEPDAGQGDTETGGPETADSSGGADGAEPNTIKRTGFLQKTFPISQVSFLLPSFVDGQLFR
jgi:hypothetical protein